MTYYHPDWVFNLVLKFAVIVSLSTLTISLITGVGPLTALLRSGAAFVTFAVLAWAASLVWEEVKIEPELEEETEEATANQPEGKDPGKTPTRRSTVDQPTQPVTPLNHPAASPSTQTSADPGHDAMPTQSRTE
ncbi:MAG TPA: hypothetical protein PKE64_14415 [Anaerolineae bacterium]|nr:hypothetical protein [Anaerolineae bacterium]